MKFLFLAGIPTIIRPFFGDQFFWADRVEALGVGSGLRKFSIESLADALILATTDVKQIARAKLVGEHIRAEDGVATAVEAIYRDLEYARSLIKKRGSDHDDLFDETDGEDTTTQDNSNPRPSGVSTSGYSSAGSMRASSEDWSVVSDAEDHRSPPRNDAAQAHKRNSLAAAMLSVLPSSKDVSH